MKTIDELVELANKRLGRRYFLVWKSPVAPYSEVRHDHKQASLRGGELAFLMGLEERDTLAARVKELEGELEYEHDVMCVYRNRLLDLCRRAGKWEEELHVELRRFDEQHADYRASVCARDAVKQAVSGEERAINEWRNI